MLGLRAGRPMGPVLEPAPAHTPGVAEGKGRWELVVGERCRVLVDIRLVLGMDIRPVALLGQTPGYTE